MEDWKEYKLGEISNITKLAGFEFTKYIKYNDTGEIIALRALNLRNGRLDLTDIKHIDKSVSDALPRSKLYKGEILFTYTGNGYGDCALVDANDKYHLAPNICKISPNSEIAASSFLFQVIRSDSFYKQVSNYIGGSSQPTIPMETIRQLKVILPPLPTQQKIAQILSSLDDKIELNNKINANLEQQAQALFKSWFVDFEPFGGEMPEGWKTCKAEEYFDITIGKTPPRKEQEWFSDVKSQNTVKWVSISDMGNCGTYISDSSEYLTKEAITKHNVKVIPADTVILSFKLTVGRIAITDDELCTNEAIAHFGTKNKDINEYLYIYLKNFNYQAMGSTSSIAVAVNSKIIKAMPFIVPDHETITKFHNIVGAIFEQIRNNQRENKKLSNLRDTLLPKLMNGEIEV